MATARAGTDRRRQILDAAVKVFARMGYNGARVSDIADEAGVAYGLLYHYFRSKDEVLDTLFLERWELMVEVIAAADAREDLSTREKLREVAGFIVESYRHDPELMKVIIVEVTRAANSFGRTHLAQIRRAYDGIARVVAGGQASGELSDRVTADFAAVAFYGAVEQVLTGWILGMLPTSELAYDQATDLIVETIFGGLQA